MFNLGVETLKRQFLSDPVGNFYPGILCTMCFELLEKCSVLFHLRKSLGANERTQFFQFFLLFKERRFYLGNEMRDIFGCNAMLDDLILEHLLNDNRKVYGGETPIAPASRRSTT